MKTNKCRVPEGETPVTWEKIGRIVKATIYVIIIAGALIVVGMIIQGNRDIALEQPPAEINPNVLVYVLCTNGHTPYTATVSNEIGIQQADVNADCEKNNGTSLPLINNYNP